MLEKHFEHYRNNTVGIDQAFETPYGTKRIVYADWIASGRLYAPIEKQLAEQIGPFVGNTHTETTITGSLMTAAYHEALNLIKKHVNACPSDVILSSNSGMTGVVNKFQRILGLRVHEKFIDQIKIEECDKPIVFVTHMEHHSNQTSWLESIADMEIIPFTAEGLVDLEGLKQLLQKYESRKTKYAAVTSYSNVTGIAAPYYEIAELMHKAGGYCFVDFACAAPYIDINMHPKNTLQKLDAVYFSPHKFLGGPGSTGILIFDSELYKNKIPDCPGGGTVEWTNPWGGHKYIENIEVREDGGTPAFLQTIRVAMCIRLKEEMGVENILKREHELSERIWPVLDEIKGLHVLAGEVRDRLGVFSFYIDGLHYNLGVKLLNDRYGIQMRGGCSCAGTYGHILLHMDSMKSAEITDKISQGDLSCKPGWIRFSIHPIMTNAEVEYILLAIQNLAENFREWKKDYEYYPDKNEYYFKGTDNKLIEIKVTDWFNFEY